MKRSSVSTGGAGRLSTQELISQDLDKPDLYTPQTTSGHSSRTRQLGKCSRSEKMKDPRPLNDKAFVHECIKQLYKFLTENGYKHHVSIKSLQAPSTKDFLRIFAFLYGFLCPSYKIPDRKFEEEIPRIFKDLGYPFALSKSSLYAVGALIPGLTSWQPCLLVFLRVNLTMLPSLYSGQIIFPLQSGKELELQIHRVMKESTTCGEETEDGIKHNKLFLDYTIKCYEKFMTGADTFEEENAELQSKLKDLYKVDASKLESLEDENRALNEQIARLEEEREKEPNCLESLKKLKASLQSDVEKYKAYLSSLESHSSILDEKLSGLDEEIGRLELQCETMREENARLQNIVDNQKYSVADIERINHEKNELQQTINKLTKDLETEQQQMWNEELKYARGKEAIEAQLADYHKLARKLKLIPKGAENSKGYDFEIKFNPEAGAKCLAKYRAQVYVPLKELLNESEEEISKALNKKIALEDTLEQLDTMKTESRRNVRMLKEEVQKLDDLYQQTVKEAEEQDEKCARELESLEKHKHLLESAVNKGLSEAMDELEAVQREYQLVLQSTTEERGKVTHDLLHLLEMVATHVGSLEKHLEEQIAKADGEYEGCMSEDLLKNIKEIAEKYKSCAALFKTPVE